MLLLVDKPSWISSFGMIKKIKRILPGKKIWHSWTLDPLATWLLIIATWNDTKKLTELIWLDKEYIANIDFSKTSDTWDIDYREKFEQLDQKDLKIPDIWEIKTILDTMIPNIELPLPAFSAKKIKWKKMYDLARSWQILQTNKLMKIYSYEIIDYTFPILKIKIKVWSWTYVRSIAYYLWTKLGLWWIIVALRRISIWDFSLE